MYIYINNKFLWEQPNTNPMTLYEKNMLFKYSMFNVDESADENDSSNENPIMLDEPDEVEIKHDPFEFSPDDKIPFSRLLSNSMVW